MNKMLKQKGFSLIEIFVSLSFLGVLLLAANAALVPWLADAGSNRNIKQMKELEDVIGRAYRANSWRTEDNNFASPRTALLVTQAGVRIPNNNPILDPAGTGNRICPEGQPTFSALAALTSNRTEEIGTDGYKNPVCIFIGQPITSQHLGVRFVYSNIYIISPGKNRVLETTVDAVRNTASTNGARFVDDYMVVISGYEIQRKAVEEAITKLDFIGEAYNSHFTSQFLAEISRDYTINYFCRPTGSGFCPGSVIQASVLRTIFQRDATLTGESVDVNSPFPGAPLGQDKMFLLNDPPSKTQPPFIANLYFAMPGGLRAEKTLAGSY